MESNETLEKATLRVQARLRGCQLRQVEADMSRYRDELTGIVRRLVELGDSHATIAKRIGVTRQTCYNWLEKDGDK